MNETEEGVVSEVFQFENSYIVAYLKKSYAEGTTALEDIEEQISALVLKEKKGAHISGAITGADLQSIATNNGQTVVSAQRANLANLSLQGIGYDPELVGSIFGTAVGSISSPIAGSGAVYVVEVTATDKGGNLVPSSTILASVGTSTTATVTASVATASITRPQRAVSSRSTTSTV